VIFEASEARRFRPMQCERIRDLIHVKAGIAILANDEFLDLEDIGVATVVLATDYANLITGETVYVDGGYDILG
jgi:enoyl-[acyl-carrier-protein] reductase (NADH)